jgi:hypothetical protein
MPRDGNSQRKRRFGTTERENVPTGRNGKHRDIVSAILSDLEGLDKGKSLKIRLSELPDTKVNVRSALNRATRQRQLGVGTATDDEFLYVWNV